MRKNVVIIGGGFAGVETAARLQEDFNVTLVDMKEYFECTVGFPVAIAEPSYLSQMTVPYASILEGITVLQGKVTEVTSEEIIYKGGRLPFDYLCICTGSSYPHPVKPQDETAITNRQTSIHEVHQKLKEAGRVLVIGGGPVGVEVAGEIASTYPEKQLTILEGGTTLLSRLHKSAQQYAENFFLENDAQVLLNEKLTSSDNNTYITDKETKIPADMVFDCTGIMPNTSFLEKNFPDHLDEKKRVRVNKNLQLQGCPNIFALGDCNNIVEEKLALNAKRHATLVVDNIKRLDSGDKVKPYVISKLFITLISCGRKKAIMATPWYALGGHVISQFKNLEVPLLMKTLTRSYPQFIWKMY